MNAELDINEVVTLGADGAEAGGSQTITISMWGVTQEFENVTDIRIADMGSDDDVLIITRAGTGTMATPTFELAPAAAIAIDAGTPTLVACGGGMSRSLAIAAAALSVLLLLPAQEWTQATPLAVSLQRSISSTSEAQLPLLPAAGLSSTGKDSG